MTSKNEKQSLWPKAPARKNERLESDRKLRRAREIVAPILGLPKTQPAKEER